MSVPQTNTSYISDKKAGLNPLIERLSIDGQLYTIHDPLVDKLAENVDRQFSYLQEAIDTKQDTLTFDTTPISGSSNPVTSDGIYTSINNLDTSLHAVAKSGNYYDLENIPTSYITKDVQNLTYYYTKDEITGYLNQINKFRYDVQDDDSILQRSPNADDMYVIYLVPASIGGGQDYYIEYISIDKGENENPRYSWEMIGTTDVAISGFVTEGALHTVLASYVTNSNLAGQLAAYYTKEQINSFSYVSHPELHQILETSAYTDITYVTTELGKKQDNLTWDNAVTENSSNQVTSGATYTAIWDAENRANQKISTLDGAAVKTVDNISPTNGNIPLEHTSLLHISYVRAEQIAASTNYQLAIGTTNTSVVTGVQTS